MPEPGCWFPTRTATGRVINLRMSWWPDSGWLRALDLTASTAASIALACGAIVALAVLDAPFLSKLPQWVLGTIVALGVLVLALFLGRIWDLGHGHWRERRQRKAVLAQLDKLNAAETERLAHLAASNEQTFYTAPYHDPVVAGLVHKGLVVRSSAGTVWSVPHSIPDFVWREIRRRWPAREQPEEEPEDIRSAVRRARAGVSRRPEG